MTQQPISAAFLRGAVDLSSLGRPAAAPTAAGAADPVVTDGTDTNFNDIVSASMSVPSVVVLWSQGLPASGEFVDVVVDVARSYEGRFQVVSVDVDANPGLLQAFQVQSVPVTLGLIQGQPVPLFAGVQSAEHVRAYVDELLKLAAQHGVTGRVDTGAPPEGAVEEEQPLPPLHQQAFEAIERDDLDGAVAAYQQALKENPADAEASLGLAQVKLMQRTVDADLAAARAAAAADPMDVPAQTLVADLDLLGGHVEDAFSRLVETVRNTSGDERNAAREHLLELFQVIGASDERVVRARRALTSALF
jgi:putative thioredoxin